MTASRKADVNFKHTSGVEKASALDTRDVSQCDSVGRTSITTRCQHRLLAVATRA